VIVQTSDNVCDPLEVAGETWAFTLNASPTGKKTSSLVKELVVVLFALALRVLSKSSACAPVICQQSNAINKLHTR
jgi:hypothetical protein